MSFLFFSVSVCSTLGKAGSRQQTHIWYDARRRRADGTHWLGRTDVCAHHSRLVSGFFASAKLQNVGFSGTFTADAPHWKHLALSQTNTRWYSTLRNVAMRTSWATAVRASYRNCLFIHAIVSMFAPKIISPQTATSSAASCVITGSHLSAAYNTSHYIYTPNSHAHAHTISYTFSSTIQKFKDFCVLNCLSY